LKYSEEWISSTGFVHRASPAMDSYLCSSDAQSCLQLLTFMLALQYNAKRNSKTVALKGLKPLIV